MMMILYIDVYIILRVFHKCTSYTLISHWTLACFRQSDVQRVRLSELILSFIHKSRSRIKISTTLYYEVTYIAI